MTIALAKALTGLTSAEFSNSVKIGDATISKGTGNSLDFGGAKITNIADGEAETDAVSKQQAKNIANQAAKDFAKDKLKAGTNVTISAPNANGEVTISATDKDTKTTVVKGDGIEVTGGNESGDTKTYTVSLDQDTKKKLAKIDGISNTANGAMQNFKVAVVDGTEATIAGGETLNFAADNNLEVKLNGKTVTYKMKDGVQFNDITAGKNGTDGTDGKVSVNGKDGSSVVINGKDGSIGLTGANGANGLTIRGDKGADGVDGANGTNGITRIIYKDANNKDHQVATLDDGLKFGGNSGETSKKLNTKFDIKGESANTTWANFDAGKNIMTQVGTDGVMTIALAKALTGLTSAEFKNATGDTTTVNGDGVSYNKADNLDTDGSVKDPNKTVSIGKDGINAGGKTISNVGEAQKDTDAVNMKQMNETIKKEIATNNASTELTFAGDFGETKAKNGKITIAGGQTDDKKLSDKPNIGVVAKDGKLNIKLAKDIDVDSVTAKDKITVGEGANKITIADGKITGITSAVDPKGELADKLKDIDNEAGKSDTDKAKEKRTAIQEALKNVSNGNVATVGDLKNVTNGLDSVVENVNNITNNVTSITNNVTNITNMVTNPDDKKKIDAAAEASKRYKDATTDEEKQKIAEEAKEVVKNNKIKTYNPYETTVKNNTTIIEAIQNMNERGIKFIHVSEKDSLGKDDNFAFDSDDSRANKKGSIGIGMNAASTAENAIATGTESTASGLNAIATGTKSEASGADSIATGTDSKASGANAIAMGTDAQAMGENTISIGTGNKVTGKHSGAIGDPTTMKNVNGVYSMGNDNFIQGGGEAAAADKTARDIFAIGNNIGSDTKKVTDKANGSVILGSKGYSNVTNGVALGYGSNASVKKGEVGYDITNANHDNDTDGVWKSTESAVSVGNVDNVEKKITRQITSVAAGTKDTDAVNVAQLKAVANQITAVTTNNGVTTSDQTFNPKTGRQVSYNPTYAPKVTNTGVNSVAIGANSVANRANTVSVGSAGNERIIANVADGVAPTDAANMRQLQSVANMVGEVKKDAMAGTASAMAIGNLPQATIPGKGMMAIGAGYYKGQTATALGVSKMSENGRWVFKASASYDSQRNVGAAGAVGFHF